jgi:hypothetical protein
MRLLDRRSRAPRSKGVRFPLDFVKLCSRFSCDQLEISAVVLDRQEGVACRR